MKRKRPKIGDIVEIQTPKGLAYAQYTFSHTDPPKYGTLLKVLPGLHKSRPDTFNALVTNKEQFFTFFPLGAACARGIVEIVANEPVSVGDEGIPLLRIAGWRGKTGEIQTWWLWDGERKWRIGVLSDDQRDLSIAEIINDTLLVERILQGWSPRDVV